MILIKIIVTLQVRALNITCIIDASNIPGGAEANEQLQALEYITVSAMSVCLIFLKYLSICLSVNVSISQSRYLSMITGECG